MNTTGISLGEMYKVRVLNYELCSSHGTALRRAIEDGCVNIASSTHVGIHGSMASAELMQEDNKAGWLTITMDEFVEHGPTVAARIVKERAGDLPTIISFDVDVLEPGECPGIGFPEPGVHQKKV